MIVLIYIIIARLYSGQPIGERCMRKIATKIRTLQSNSMYKYMVTDETYICNIFERVGGQGRGDSDRYGCICGRV